MTRKQRDAALKRWAKVPAAERAEVMRAAQSEAARLRRERVDARMAADHRRAVELVAEAHPDDYHYAVGLASDRSAAGIATELRRIYAARVIDAGGGTEPRNTTERGTDVGHHEEGRPACQPIAQEVREDHHRDQGRA